MTGAESEVPTEYDESLSAVEIVTAITVVFSVVVGIVGALEGHTDALIVPFFGVFAGLLILYGHYASNPDRVHPKHREGCSDE